MFSLAMRMSVLSWMSAPATASDGRAVRSSIVLRSLEVSLKTFNRLNFILAKRTIFLIFRQHVNATFTHLKRNMSKYLHVYVVNAMIF